MIYLDEADLVRIAERALGDQPVVIRDLGLLSMSAQRPQTFAFGFEPYHSLAEKAAALLVAICMNHPLQDGNKRLALAATAVFIEINAGKPLDLSNDAAYELVMGVARGELDVPEVAEIFFMAHGVE